MNPEVSERRDKYRAIVPQASITLRLDRGIKVQLKQLNTPAKQGVGSR